MRALALTLLLATLPAAPSAAEDFEEAEPVRSLAFGLPPSGRGLVSVDLGYLWSALRLDLGIAHSVGLFLWVDSMLLYRGVAAQNGIHGGVRLAPITEGTLRVTLDLSGGQVLTPVRVGTEILTEIRGDLVAGAAFERFTAYTRITLRGLHGGPEGRPAFVREEELGLGVETAVRRFVFGAEAFVWARPSHAGFPQWRLRAGLVL